MLLMRVGLLCALLTFIAAYPLEAAVKPVRNEELDPAEYPDLTNGLSDAEVESTLNGLSLDDLNALNKLLDDAGNGPFDLKASLRGHHRQAKKQPYADVDSVNEDQESALKPDRQTEDDACHDEDEEEEKDNCTQQPKCNKRPTTRRCSGTTRKSTTPCRSLDGFLDIHLDGSKSDRNKAKLKCKTVEECDPEDTMCLQRLQHRSMQRPSMHDFATVSENHGPFAMDSLEKLAAQAHRNDALKLNRQLKNWNVKEDAIPEVSNMDYDKLANVDAFKESPKVDSAWARVNVAEDEVGQSQQNEKLLNMPYERHELARSANGRRQRQEEEEDDKQTEELDENMQLDDPAELGVNEGDSFIAHNARDPLRYLIQTDEGYGKSEIEPIENQLRTDREHSEMLNYEPYQPANKRVPLQDQLQQSKRIKRENNIRKCDDDSAELSQKADGLVSP
ncbi:uncharacterized protein LOC111603521 isoform X2 [Drosophila hydei]|uniref:Uncharacterized protein LOC111603521 isoform X2 n=1 Tax=Drosophila hydei TaxID=7224 RepID=A0A6J2SNC5_DROHY|nr:uncharacterized protein LOC111603521 isoform X2 [Drosophila hydei]